MKQYNKSNLKLAIVFLIFTGLESYFDNFDSAKIFFFTGVYFTLMSIFDFFIPQSGTFSFSISFRNDNPPQENPEKIIEISK